MRSLKLRATDEDDVRILSACLQDAILPVCDITYQPEAQRLVFVANRFRWECCADIRGLNDAAAVRPADGSAPYERTNCGVRLDGVTAVKTKGLDLKARDQMLNLLAVEVSEQTLFLHFAGGGCLRVDVSRIDIHLDDIGEPWPTAVLPRHPVDEHPIAGTSGAERTAAA